MITPVRGRSTFRALSRAPVGRGGSVRARCVPTPATSAPRTRRSAGELDPGPTSVAYAIGRRHGPAVARNRIRRRLRAAVAELDRRGGVLQPGASYLLMSDAEAAACPFADLVTWVEGALRQATTRSERAVAAGPPPPAGPAEEQRRTRPR